MDNFVPRRKLITYLPDFMKQFYEIQEIMKAEDVEFDRMDFSMQKVLNNAFIEDADEYGIKKYETLLGIVPSANDTLESRRSRVLLRWNDKVPYTYRVLIYKLNVLCGVNNYDLVSDQANYYLHFSTYLELFGQVKELEDYLEKTLPENIYYESVNTLNCISRGNALTAGGICLVGKVQVTNDFIEHMQIDGDALMGGGLTDADIIHTSNDFNAVTNIDGQTLVAGGVSGNSKILITNDFTENYDSDGDVLVASGTVSVDFFEI